MRPLQLGTLLIWAGLRLAAQANPVPLVNDPLVPGSVAPGSAAFTLTVNGVGFTSGSVVNWNGNPRATAFVSGSQLTASIAAADLAAAGTASVTVTNPAPGGGTSNVVFFPVTPPAATVSLATAATYPSIYPSSTITGDWNGDGRLDLVVANTNPGAVQLSLGNGDGTFQAPTTISNASAVAVAGGDFNHDGKLDLVIVAAGVLTILLGNGDGTFRAAPSISASPFPSSIAIGDYDRDGNLDLAEGARGSQITIFRGNGDGTFQPPLHHHLKQAGATIHSLAAGDFNSDGILDLAVLVTKGVYLVLGKGDGTFRNGGWIPLAGGGPSALITADFNGDGKLDIAATWQGGLAVILGKGHGGFHPPVTYPGTYLAAGDFNGDGKLDLATILKGPSGSNIGALAVLLGKGNGTFRKPVSTAAQAMSVGLVAGDFNGDGRLDLATLQIADSTALSINLQTSASVSPSLVSFLPALIRTTTKPKTITVTNTGTANLDVSQVSLSGPGAAKFTLTSDACQGASIPPAGNCTVAVTYSPTAAETDTAFLSITDDALAGVQVAALTATATALDVTPATLDFGSVAVHTIGPEKLVTIKNVSNATVDLSFSQFGSDPFDFVRSTSCGAELPAKTSCTIIVQFTPTKKGTRTAEIFVTSDGGDPRPIALSGTGT